MKEALIIYYIGLKVELKNFVNYILFFGVIITNLHFTVTAGKDGRRKRRNYFIRINGGPERF